MGGAVLPGTCRETRMNVCDLHRCLDCPLLLPAFCHVESQREKHYYILKQEKNTWNPGKLCPAFLLLKRRSTWYSTMVTCEPETRKAGLGQTVRIRTLVSSPHTQCTWGCVCTVVSFFLVFVLLFWEPREKKWQ